MKYFKNILVAVDQLGNAICYGNPDVTISARVGYYSQVERVYLYYWRTLEKIINFTFWPVDGPNHCKEAFEADPEEVFNDSFGDFFRILLSAIIVIACIPISILIYLFWAISKIIAYL